MSLAGDMQKSSQKNQVTQKLKVSKWYFLQEKRDDPEEEEEAQMVRPYNTAGFKSVEIQKRPENGFGFQNDY